MIAADSYLHIPEAYARWLGGLRWSTGGEAIESPDGRTLAFGRELSLFLDGFAAGRDPIHFAHVLHLMHLLLRGPLTSDRPMPMDLVGGFAVLGRPHRNAGAFCAMLCADVPGLPDPPDVEAVCLLLTAGGALADYRESGDDGADLVLWGGYGPDATREWPVAAIDEPPMLPAEFEGLVIDRLARQTPEWVRHWLRNGRSPEPDARPLADRIAAEPPRSYREALDPLLERPRLSGAATLIDRLVGALALPPRRLTAEALPTGGYADVTNRGHPERLLPSQHAIDPEEFLRRFAEHELLFYRREEPHAPEPEELVVLVDQGVRTWGPVRPVLAAAAVALGRLADRRRVALRLGASAAPGRLLDPIAAEPDDLAALLEASDLSEHPGPALGAALAGGSGRRRDVVLLTHPRALIEPEVEAAARGVSPADRLFAVAVDDRREVRLSEVRHGRPVALARFRAEPIERPDPARVAPPGAWEGDVEPIGFPFRFGPSGGPPPRNGEPMFAFDEAGDWLAAIGPHGVPFAWRVDGTPAGPWPRGFSAGEVVHAVDALLGVASGFVVAGRLGPAGRPAAVHYDLVSRRVRTYVEARPLDPARDWFYVRESHALVGRGREGGWWHVDLRTGVRSSSRARDPSGAVARDLGRIRGLSAPPPRLLLLHDDDTRPAAGPSIRLDRASGKVTLDGVDPPWRPFRPVSDGRPVLVGRELGRALLRGRTLALHVSGPGAPRGAWHVLSGPSPTVLPERRTEAANDLILSPDGKMVSVRSREHNYAVYAADSAGPPLMATARGGAPRRPEVSLGQDWILLHDGQHSALMHWGRDRLEIRFAPDEGASSRDALTRRLATTTVGVSRFGLLPGWASYDRRRFKATCRGLGLVATTDAFGQVALADVSGRLICMLLFSPGRLAAWMPDGIRLGPPTLNGGPPTPGAEGRIAAALRAAGRAS